jgi:hypothetical protein
MSVKFTRLFFFWFNKIEKEANATTKPSNNRNLEEVVEVNPLNKISIKLNEKIAKDT